MISHKRLWLSLGKLLTIELGILLLLLLFGDCFVFYAIISPPLHWHWQWWWIYERDFWWNPAGRRIDEDGDPSFWRRIAHSWQLVTNSSKPSGCRNLWQIQIQRFPGLQIRVTNTNTCHPHVLPQFLNCMQVRRCGWYTQIQKLPEKKQKYQNTIRQNSIKIEMFALFPLVIRIVCKVVSNYPKLTFLMLRP